MNTELAPGLNLSARDFETRLYSIGRNLDALSAFSALLDIAVMHDPGILQSSDSGLAYLLDRHIGDIRETSDQLEQYRWRLTQFEELKEALSNDLGRLEADHQDRKDRAEERLRSIMRSEFARADAEDAAHEARIREIIRTAVLAEASRPAWHDLDMIAARACVDRADVARVMFVLTGEDHAGETYRDGRGHPAEGMAAHLLALQINRALAHGEIWGRVSDATGLELDRLREVLEAVLTHLPRRAGYKGQIAEMQEASRADADMREQAAERIAQGPSAEKLRETLEAVVGDDPETGGMSATIARIADESGLSSASVARVVGMLLAEVGETPESPEEEPTPAPRGRRKVN